MENAVFSDEESLFCDEVTRAVYKNFGISYLYPWQRIVISNILDSVSITKPDSRSEEQSDLFYYGRQIVLLPTGAGKSLCFMTPALFLKGPTLIIYPLLALMSDQKRRIDEAKLSCAVFMGGQSPQEREENFKLLENNAPFIIANPEVLQNKTLLSRLKNFNIQHIAIDEAHCVSEWGDSFRPAYLSLGEIIAFLDPPAVTAFTATASPSVLSRVSEVLFGGTVHLVRGASDRPNIHYTVIKTGSKKQKLLALLKTCRRPLLVFCGTREASENISREIALLYGRDIVRFYHAGLSRQEKTQIEQWFYSRQNAILCCTCAYGMGVDKKDIRTVIHYAPSPTAEAYIQEAGRAARDGGIGNAILLWSLSDFCAAKGFPQGSRERVLLDFAESKTCRRQVLLNALGAEEVACDGCDVCWRKKEAPFAKDIKTILRKVYANRKVFDRQSLADFLQKEFNDFALKIHKCATWDYDDVQDLIFQALESKLLLECDFPWKNKIDISSEGKSLLMKEKQTQRIRNANFIQRKPFLQGILFPQVHFEQAQTF